MINETDRRKIDIDNEIIKLVKSNHCRTLRELSELLSRRLNVPSEVVAYRAWLLWKKGDIDIVPPNAQGTVINYIFSVDALWFWISLAITLSAFSLIYLGNLFIVNVLRAIVGSVFIVFILGYSVVEFIYPRGDEIKPLERFVLSLGLSIVIMPLVGTFLSYMPFRYTITSVTVTLTLITTMFLILASIRKARYVMDLSRQCIR